MQGDNPPISIGGGIRLADASVVSADTDPSDGVIHVVDRVLPPAAA